MKTSFLQHRLSTALLALGGLAAGAGPAAAQRMPDMATLDRGDGISRIGLDFAAGFVDDQFGGIDAALRFEPFAQYVSRGGFGLYGALPIARLVTDGDDETALGNLELGALYVIESRALSYVFRAGIALPTADDDLEGVTANFFASWTRLTDLALAVPDATYARFAFSPLYHADRLFIRIDLGFDVAVQDDDDLPGQEPGNLFRLNLGGGIDLGTVALMAELVNIASTESFDDEDDDDFVHTLAFSARFMGESLQPYFTLGLPVDSFGREVLDFFLGAGLQVRY
jgi:hypothetical protein